MSDQISFLDAVEDLAHRRSARRNFIRMCGGAAAMTGGLSLLAACGEGEGPDPTPSPTPTATPTSASQDVSVFQFALQLEYLEAQYYTYAVTGFGIPLTLQNGAGTQGAVVTGTGPGAARAVTFTGSADDRVVGEIAREIAADEIAHVTFIRASLGTLVVAQPTINLSGSASVTLPNGSTAVGAFTAAARAAGVIGATEIFDPFASVENFLIGSYLLTDVGVTAYRGSARLITNKTFVEASAGILATECYHDGVIRSSLWQRGIAANSTLHARIQAISDTRDGLDGAADLDQGVGNATTANFVPTTPTTDGNGNPVAGGLVLGRTAQQVLNVVYQNRASVTSGGFFPSGVNGQITASAAN